LLNDPAADALRALGTNAVPYLEGQLRKREKGWERKYRQLYGRLPPAIRKLAPSPSRPRELIQVDAAWALVALGTNAGSGVKAVIEVYASEPQMRRLGALNESLRQLEWPPEAFDRALADFTRRGEFTDAVRTIETFELASLRALCTLTNALVSTNALTKENAIHQLRRFGSRAAFALPALRTALTDPDLTVRQSAAWVLEYYGPDAAPALAELTVALNAADGELRYRAARALEAMGTNALPAAAALAAATNDANTMVQTVAERALKKLREH
jgi:hypothetical protein